MTGQIPNSPALAEARVDSLAELLSRDPEGYQTQDLDRIIEVLREQRVKWKAAEEAGGRTRQPKGSSPQPVGTRTTNESLDDLGL